MQKMGQRTTFNEINITPLTDIFLVLLIIMMVVAPMLDSTGLKLSVPSVGPSEEITEEPKIIKITIDEMGKYALSVPEEEPEAMTLPFIAQKLRELKTDYPDGVIIETHPESTHESLALAMDTVQGTGVTKLAVMSSQLEEEPMGEEDVTGEVY